MPEWVIPLLTLIFGGGLGGLATYLRTRTQNRVDERVQLSSEQLALRQRIDTELARLDQRILTVEAENKELRKVNEGQFKTIAGLETSQALMQEDNKDLSAQVDQLQAKSIQLQDQLTAVVDEKAQLNQRVQVAENIKQFLERENNTLRTEIERLQRLLPQREVKGQTPAGGTPIAT